MIPKIIAATVTGLVCVSCCALFAFAMGGAGHGWLTPLFVSLSGFVLFPLTFSCAATRASRTLCMAVLVLLALADVALYLKTQNEGVEYFYRAGGFGLFWIAMWLAGHVPAAWPLVFPRHAEEFEDAFD